MKRMVMAAAAAAMVSGTMIAPTTASASTPPAAVAACSEWWDHAGPGGAGRYHVSCAGSGLYVRARVYCADGSSSLSAYRWEYAKAECPYGVDAVDGTYTTRR